MAFTVPDTFAPSVGQGEMPMVPATSGVINPMRNRAPEQLVRTGQVLEQAGAVASSIGNTIGDRLQETIDDGLSKNAETKFLNSASQIVSGYTRTLGQNAIDGYKDASESIVKAKSDAEATLTNDIQRHMFNSVATQHLMNIGKTLSDHQFQQTVKFGSDAAKDRSDNMIQAAANTYSDWQQPTGKFAINKNTAITEVLHAASLLGLPPDSPQAQQLVREQTTELARGVITRMQDKEQFDEAQNYYDQALAAGEIDERTAEQLGASIAEGHSSVKGKNLSTTANQVALGNPDSWNLLPGLIPGSSITSSSSTVPITDVPGSPRPGGRVHDGVDIAIPVGTQVQARGNATVSKVWNDTKFGGGLSMEISYPNGYTEGIAHLSSVNYQPGQKVTQGAIIALSGKSGNATGATVHWAMKDPNGNWVDPRNVAPAQKNLADFTDPDMLQKGIDYINSSDETQRVKDIAINQLKTNYDTARTIQNQKYQQAKQQAVDLLTQNGGNVAALPSALKMQLHPSDLADFQADRDDEQRKQSEIDLRANWIEHPDQQTVNAVKEAYQKKQLTDSIYLEALRYANEHKLDDDHVDTQKTLPTKVTDEQINATLVKNGFGELVSPMKGIKPEQAQSYKEEHLLLRDHIVQSIQAEQQLYGRAVSPERKQQIIDQAILDRIHIGNPNANDSVKGGWQFAWNVRQSAGQAQTNYVTLDNNQRVNTSYIPQAVRDRISDALSRKGYMHTEKNIAQRWDELGRPLK